MVDPYQMMNELFTLYCIFEDLKEALICLIIIHIYIVFIKW
jgi:hypothetical protein